MILLGHLLIPNLAFIALQTHLVIDGAAWYRKNGDQAYFVNALTRVRDLMRSTRDLFVLRSRLARPCVVLPPPSDALPYLPRLSSHRRVSSSTWRPYFNPALERYPMWTQDGIYLDRDEVYPRCDGCGAQKKPGKIKVDLRGDEYDRDTFKVSLRPLLPVESPR